MNSTPDPTFVNAGGDTSTHNVLLRARSTAHDSARNKRARVHRGSFGSAEEAALHYVKLLKFEGNKYSAKATLPDLGILYTVSTSTMTAL